MSGLGWGQAQGAAQTSDVTYMKLENGDTQFRIVSNVLARMDYWVPNKDGKNRPFECLRFDRMLEKFIRGAADPVSDLGLMEADPEKKGAMRPMRCKRAYKCMVINRKTGKVEAMDLKKSIFDGIIATMGELEVQDPTSIDFVVTRTGDKWYEVAYKINEIKTFKLNGSAEVAKLHAGDQELIDGMKSLDELFPRMSADEMKVELDAWVSGSASDEKKSDEAKQQEKEDISDLDD